MLRVSGQVFDFNTAASVAGQLVRWQPLEGDRLLPSVQVLSDASGRFELVLPVADRFSVSVETPGRLGSVASGIVRVPGKRFDTELLVNSGPCSVRYGQVFDAVTRAPIAGATVQRAGTAVTDGNGYYLINNGCEPRPLGYWGIGTTTITAGHPAYLGAFEFDGRRESTSNPGIRRVDFALQPRAAQ